MSIQSNEGAIDILTDRNNSEMEREEAVRYLADHPQPRALEKLVAMLEDPDAGVRWVITESLTDVGRPALPPLLRALMQCSNSVWLRQAALHILKHTSDGMLYVKSQPLIEALTGPAAALATEEAAGALWLELKDKVER